MAVTVTPVVQGTLYFSADITATADGDTVTGNIAHGLGVVPDAVLVDGRAAEAALSLWQATTVDATNVVMTKTTAVGSGAAGVQARIHAFAFHSIIR